MVQPRGSGGQALPLVLAVLAVGLVALLAAGRLAAGWVAAGQARTAADAAALACLGGGAPAAAAVAEANGARLVGARADFGSCTVEVAVGGSRATARAAWRVRGAGP
jgi:hypothetical protein